MVTNLSLLPSMDFRYSIEKNYPQGFLGPLGAVFS